MKAAVYEKYGAPEVVRIMNTSLPVPGEKQVLIKIYYSTVNRTDSGFRSAVYVISRLFSGIFRPKQKILGCEFSGEILAVGKSVKKFKPGDRIFGYDDVGFGGHAEFAVKDENAHLAIIPSNMDYRDAAPMLEGSHYALTNLRAANIGKGSNVMVYGATGAIGSAAVQICKALGASVTAVCKGMHMDLVKSLGADMVIDYQHSDFTKCGQQFDLVFDAVGKSSYGACKPLLLPHGIYISTELGKNGQNVWFGILGIMKKGKKVKFPLPVMNDEILTFIRELAERGDFKPVIDREFSLDDIVAAHRYVDSGEKIGNVLIRIFN